MSAKLTQYHEIDVILELCEDAHEICYLANNQADRHRCYYITDQVSVIWKTLLNGMKFEMYRRLSY